MIPAAVFDPQRLAAVRATGLLDTEPEEPFDRLASLAATLLEAPLAFVTIVDDTRSFWKSCIGVEPGGPRQNSVEDSFCQYVVGSSEPLMVGDARANDTTRANPSIESMGVRAWAGFPVRAPTGEVLGSFCVVDTVVRQWSDRDATVLKALAASASSEVALRTALEDSRKAAARLLAYGEENATLAATLQQSLLPRELPTVAGADIAARYRPAGSGTLVTGDFFDVFETGKSRWGAVMGDVAGHGAEAARLAALARYTIRTAAMSHRRPTRVLATLNAALLDQAEDDERFLTIAYVSAAPAQHGLRLKVACAGHPPPLLRQADGCVIEVGDCAGTLLGCLPDPPLHDVKLELGAGEMLVLYTDGITEARHGRGFFGPQRLNDVVGAAGGSAADVAEQVELAVVEHSGGELRDDAAVLVIAAT